MRCLAKITNLKFRECRFVSGLQNFKIKLPSDLFYDENLVNKTLRSTFLVGICLKGIIRISNFEILRM
jgi:hypothetical protein